MQWTLVGLKRLLLLLPLMLAYPERVISKRTSQWISDTDCIQLVTVTKLILSSTFVMYRWFSHDALDKSHSLYECYVRPFHASLLFINCDFEEWKRLTRESESISLVRVRLLTSMTQSVASSERNTHPATQKNNLRREKCNRNQVFFCFLFSYSDWD